MGTNNLKGLFDKLPEGLQQVFREKGLENIKANLYGLLQEHDPGMRNAQNVFALLSAVDAVLQQQGRDKAFLDALYLLARGLDAYVKDQAVRLNDQISRGMGIPIRLEYSPRKFTDRIAPAVEQILVSRVVKMVRETDGLTVDAVETKAEDLAKTKAEKDKDKAEKTKAENPAA